MRGLRGHHGEWLSRHGARRPGHQVPAYRSLALPTGLTNDAITSIVSDRLGHVVQAFGAASPLAQQYEFELRHISTKEVRDGSCVGSARCSFEEADTFQILMNEDKRTSPTRMSLLGALESSEYLAWEELSGKHPCQPSSCAVSSLSPLEGQPGGGDDLLAEFQGRTG